MKLFERNQLLGNIGGKSLPVDAARQDQLVKIRDHCGRSPEFVYFLEDAYVFLGQLLRKIDFLGHAVAGYAVERGIVHWVSLLRKIRCTQKCWTGSSV
jgi:hypothetical protein